jgi:hypothetical protein
MIVKDVHVLPFSMAPERLEISLILRKNHESCFVQRLRMLKVVHVDVVGLVLSSSNIVNFMGCES